MHFTPGFGCKLVAVIPSDQCFHTYILEPSAQFHYVWSTDMLNILYSALSWPNWCYTYVIKGKAYISFEMKSPHGMNLNWTGLQVHEHNQFKTHSHASMLGAIFFFFFYIYLFIYCNPSLFTHRASPRYWVKKIWTSVKTKGEMRNEKINESFKLL